jgi:phosphoribosylanthranilate isomerase
MPERTTMVKVKICGITNEEDARFASFQGADALGFIFSKKSPRYIQEKAAKKIIERLDPFIHTVGVFVDEPRENVVRIAESLGLEGLQFHGSESPAYCRVFVGKYKVIKTLFASQQPFAKLISRYKVDAYLFDIPFEQKQRGGKALSSRVLGEIRSVIQKGERVIISGGLTPQTLSGAKKINPYALDVCSGIEQFVGKKDKQLVREFIRKAKHENT